MRAEREQRGVVDEAAGRDHWQRGLGNRDLRCGFLLGRRTVIAYTDGAEHAARTAATRAVVTEFARLFYTERDVRGAFETFVAPGYIQHNPGIADGRDAAVAALAPKFADPDFHADLQRVLADSDYGVIHLHGYRTSERGGAVVDLYRVADGKIAEHWDVIQPIPETARNDHPLL